MIAWTATFTAIMTVNAVFVDKGKRWPWPLCLFYSFTLLHVLWTSIHAAAIVLIHRG